MGNRISRNRMHADQIEMEDSVKNESFEVIFLDEKSEEILLQTESYVQQISALKNNNFRFFDDYLECGIYLYALLTSTRVILVVEEQLAEDIVYAAHNLTPVKCIFIVHPISINPSDLFSQYVKVKDTTIDQLTDRIAVFEARFLRNTKEFFSVDIFNTNQMMERSSIEITGRFLFTQLLLDILLRMERKATDRDEFIARCSEFFINEPSNMQKLDKFHHNYEEEKVFEWYSKDSFIYRLLNKALRTLNIDLLFLCRFLLQDLESQLILHQERTPVHVYRGQRILRKELEDLANELNQYISMTSILSTSLQRNIAEIYLSKDNADTDKSDEVSVIFEIEANPNLPGGVKPFANIARFSQFPIEEEIVFMAGCIFRIIAVKIMEPFSIVQMKLCSNEENSLRTLFEALRREYCGYSAERNETSINSFAIVLYNMKEFNLANRFFRRIYHETSFNDPNRARYCMNIGNTIVHTGRYKECAQWYDRALELYEVHGFKNHPPIGTLHLVRANLFSKMNKHRRALDSYNMALSIFLLNLGENHPRTALCYNAMGQFFEKRRQIDTAIEYYEKSLHISEMVSPSAHPSLIRDHLCLAQAFLYSRHQDLKRASYHAQTALRMNDISSLDRSTSLNIQLTIHEICKRIEMDKKQNLFVADVIEAHGSTSALSG